MVARAEPSFSVVGSTMNGLVLLFSSTKAPSKLSLRDSVSGGL